MTTKPFRRQLPQPPEFLEALQRGDERRSRCSVPDTVQDFGAYLDHTIKAWESLRQSQVGMRLNEDQKGDLEHCYLHALDLARDFVRMSLRLPHVPKQSGQGQRYRHALGLPADFAGSVELPPLPQECDNPLVGLRSLHRWTLECAKLEAEKCTAQETEAGKGGPGFKGSGPKYVFRKIGDYWEVSFEDEKPHLKHLNGCTYIAWLLQHPNEPVSAVELYHEVNKPVMPKRVPDEGHLPGEDKSTGFSKEWASKQNVQDRRSWQENKERSRELLEQLDRAKRDGDASQEAELRQEMKDLAEQMKKVKNLRGGARSFADVPERARGAVCNRIRDVLGRIDRKKYPKLYKHLSSALDLGGDLCYKPDREIAWTVE